MINDDASKAVISDLQLAQLNLQGYEFESRLLLPRIGGLSSVEEFENLPHKDKEQLMKESNDFMIHTYIKYVTRRHFDMLIDGGDFIFNLNQSKMDFLKKNTSIHKLFDTIKGFKESYLIIGNHEWKDLNAYLKYFKKVVPYLWYYDKREEEYVIYTHYPLTKEIILPGSPSEILSELTGYECDLNDKFICNLYNDFRTEEFLNTKVRNIHGHVHSKGVPEDRKLDNVRYENVCLDYLIKTKRIEI